MTICHNPNITFVIFATIDNVLVNLAKRGYCNDDVCVSLCVSVCLCVYLCVHFPISHQCGSIVTKLYMEIARYDI